MSVASNFPPITSDSTAALRVERAWLLARYDSGAVSPATLKVIRSLECDIAWREHAQRLRDEGGAS
jgi:hypothetical protein